MNKKQVGALIKMLSSNNLKSRPILQNMVTIESEDHKYLCATDTYCAVFLKVSDDTPVGMGFSLQEIETWYKLAKARDDFKLVPTQMFSGYPEMKNMIVGVVVPQKQLFISSEKLHNIALILGTELSVLEIDLVENPKPLRINWDEPNRAILLPCRKYK